ncbi:RING-type E3 ubiquitin transferase [Sarracenia purpurea var. burkii]
MQRQRSSSNFISSFNHGSIINNHGLIRQNVESLNASGQGDHNSSIGWIGQSSSIGSSHNQVTPESSNFSTSQRFVEMQLEPNDDKISSTGVVTSDAVSQKLDRNVAYEDSNGNTGLELGVDYVNQTSCLERNTEIFERNTRRRIINSANEYDLPSSNMSSDVSVATTTTSQMFQPSYPDWITSPSSSSTSSISRVIPASGSDAMCQEENSRYIPRGNSMHSFIVHGTERENPGQTLTNSRPVPQNYSSLTGTTGVQISAPWQNMLVSGTERGNQGHQNLINSRATVPRNYSSQNGATSAHLSPPLGFPQHNDIRGFQNGFNGGVHLSSTPLGFPPRNVVEEYEQRLSDLVNRSRMRLDGFGSGGQIGYHNPPSITSVTMRGMLESGPDNISEHQRFPRPRILMVRPEGHTDVVPPILPPSQPLAAAQPRARMVVSREYFSIGEIDLKRWLHPMLSSPVHRALEILNRIDGIGLQYEVKSFARLILYSNYQDGLIGHGPMFYEEYHHMHEDMRLDVDDMSYEELLALEDEIGNMSTGLSEEAILVGLRRHSYQSMRLRSPMQRELCCICQDDYVDGDEFTKLDCGHEFHFNCIKQWLMRKNTCPICKTIALRYLREITG